MLAFFIIVVFVGFMVLCIYGSYQRHKSNNENADSDNENADSDNKLENTISIKITGSIEEAPPIFEKRVASEKHNVSKNIWFMTRYKITGINPATKRKKGVEVIILGNNEDTAVKKSGLMDIISIDKIEEYEPSDAQINYGRNLGVSYDCNYTREDYSAILTLIEDKTTFMITPYELAEYAAKYNIFISSYWSLQYVLNILFSKLPNKEKILFFTMSVYQYYNGFNAHVPDRHPKYKDFLEFYETVKENNSFNNSIRSYNGIDLVPKKSIKNLKAKEICMEYFNL